MRQFQQGVRPIRGEIISQDEKSENTSINKAAQGSKSDLKVGEQVLVLGSQNSDGSVTAQNIQLNPQNGFRNRQD